jgi:hypothetical protein
MAEEPDVEGLEGADDGPVLRRRPGSGAEQLHFQTTTRHTRAFRTWFRGRRAQQNPTAARLLDPGAAQRFVLHGWTPAEPQIGRDTRVTAFGSCFATHISDWLARRHYRVLTRPQEGGGGAYVVSCGEGMVNSFVIRQQFEWAWENRRFDLPLWHGYDAREYGYDPDVQAETRRIFDTTDVFVLTFGLSEIWYDTPTGEVFWRTLPRDVYDPARHRFRVSTVEENRDNLRAIYRMIRTHRPEARVVFTLSPIQLIATFRDNSCVTSNAVSKAILRVAIDEVVRESAGDGALFYWPSYELVTDIFRSAMKPDRRHPQQEVLDCIMTLFEHAWCRSDAEPRPSLTLPWARACAVSGLLPPRMAAAVLDGNAQALSRALSRTLSDDPRLADAMRSLGEAVLSEWIASGQAAVLAPPQSLWSRLRARLGG